MKKLYALLAAIFLLYAIPAFAALDGLAPLGGSATAIKTDADLEYAEFLKRAGVRSVTVGGTADAITGTSVNVATTALSDGLSSDFTATASNTGATTYQLDATAATTVRRADGTALVGGDIQNGTRYRVVYHAATTQWRLRWAVQAVEIRNVAAGNIAATTVQGAINELDTEKQPADADLTAFAGVTPSANGLSLVSAANYAAMKALLDLEIGVDLQAFDSDLTTWAGLTPSANHQTLVTQTFAQMRASLDLEAGTDFNAFSARLADVSGITYNQGDIFYFNGTNIIDLAPGTSGQFLKTQGAAANPIWETIPGGGDMLAANNLSDVASAATAFSNIKQAASQTATGVVEEATDAEIITATDADRYVTPAGLKRKNESLCVAASDEITDLTTGTAKVTWRMPYAFTLTNIRGSVNDAAAGTLITVDVNEGGTTVISTKLTIDIAEETSVTAATAVVISDTTLADDAEMTIDIDGIGTTAKGLKVCLIGYQT